jgi:tetratricopeptide (TPR) repeat protein
MKKHIIEGLMITMWVAITCYPFVLSAQESKQIKRINRSLFEFKQEFLELKEDFLKKEQTWNSQQEQFELLIKKLNSENLAAQQEAIKLREQVEKFEEILNTSDVKKLGSDVQDIAILLDLLIYNEIGEPQHTASLLLKLINRYDSAISKDLLLFYLARYMNSIGESDFALGYYSNILTDFPESRLVSKAIYEMALIFGESGQDQDQITLLLQLASQEEPDKYGKRAIEKLQALGVEVPRNQKQDVSMEDFPTESIPEESEKKDEFDIDSLEFSFDE